MKKKFEDLSKEYETMLNDKVAALAGEIKTVGFANPEAVVEGLTVQQKIATLSKMKENLATSKPMSGGANFEKAQVPPAQTAEVKLASDLAEMGLTDLWNTVHKQGA